MDHVAVAAQTGRPTGTRPSRRLRRDGLVPGVVYGMGADPVTVAVGYRDLRIALTGEAGLNALIDLQLDGSDSVLTIVKDLQRDPIRQEVTHVDFIRIDVHARVSVEVPVVLVGEALEVSREGGIVEQILTLLPVNAPATAIPPHLEHDISALEVGDTVVVGDLSLPAGVEAEVEPDEPVVTAQITRAALAADEEEAAAAEAAEGEEGAEGEGADGGGTESDGDSGDGGGDSADG